MAHGVTEVLSEGSSVKMVHQKQQHQPVHQQQQQQQQQQNTRKSVGVMGSRRIFAPAFKLKVLDSYRNDIDCRGNQRATARKYGIHRRQIQKWLQCEDNLRNSCAETGNPGSVQAATSSVPSAGVPKPDGTVTEATGSAVTPAAPALNLSLARLHGDELTTHQGPPPLLSHPPSHASSSPSPQYPSQTGIAVLPLRVGYQDYPPNQEHHLHREPEERVQVPDVHGYPETRVIDHENNYYVINPDGQKEPESSPNSFDGRSEVKVYQTLTSYRLPRPDHRYVNENETGLQHRTSPGHRRSVHEPNYGEMESSSIDEKSSYGSLLAPSMIKTERASPDSAATPGPCELASSPGASRVPLSPFSSHQASNCSSNSISSNVGSTMSSVHSDSPRPSASPRSTHVYVHEHIHGSSPRLDTEKSIRCLRERVELNETPVQVREKGATEEAARAVEVGGRPAVVKEELHLEEEELQEEEEEEGLTEGGEGVGASSCTDYQRPPAGSSVAGSRPVSPIHDPREGYSLPSSPRGHASSERSSSSCSDSDMDPLDCSPGSQGSTNDLTRRRSFSLRFKLDVLDAFHRDAGVAGNQRATARKFGINRRQVQKWLGQETELRGEIALRGNSRQRLGPVQDAASGESPVDLRTTNYVSSLSHDRIETEYERSPPPLYCCDVGSSSSQHHPYYHPSSETEPVPCNLSCCTDTHAVTSNGPCYQELAVRGACYGETQNRIYCYSPRDYQEIGSIPESIEERSSPIKRQHCTLSCCYEALPSPKRLCLEPEDPGRTCQDTPPQETPLCLVKPKRPFEGSTMEPVTSTVPTPPTPQTARKDAILFKPYLDNPVSKPTKEVPQRGLSPLSSQNVNANNNNNCQSICNLNEGRGHDYALELSLRLPVSWRTHSSPYAEFPQLRSAFFRYPASPHYT